MKNVLQLLVKSELILLGLTAAAPGAGIQKSLIVWSNETNHTKR